MFQLLEDIPVSAILSFFLLLFLKQLTSIVHSYILKPYHLIKFYRAQGIEMSFSPFQSFYSRDIENVNKHGNYFHNWIVKTLREPRPLAFGGNYGKETQLVILDPIVIKDFAQKIDYYVRHPILLEPFFMLFGRSILTTDGDEWRQKRKLISQAFHFELLRDFVPEIYKIANDRLESWREDNLDQISIATGFQKITGEVVGGMVFGRAFSKKMIDGQQIHLLLGNCSREVGELTYDPMFSMFGKTLGKLGINKYHKKILKDIDHVRQGCYEFVTEMMQEAKMRYEKGVKLERKTLIDVLYEQRILNPKEYLTDWEVTDEFMNFTIGGMDTEGHGLIAAAYYLMKHPEYIPRLREEANRYLTDKIDLDVVNKMEFTGAFLKETLRIAPPGPFTFERLATKDHNIGSLKIKKGTTVIVGIISNHHDPRYFEDPEKFYPERWLDENSLTCKSVAQNPFIYNPFHGGPRNCIGQQLAMVEGKIVFGTYIKKYDVKFCNPNYEMKWTLRTLLEPDEDIICQVTPTGVN